MPKRSKDEYSDEEEDEGYSSLEEEVRQGSPRSV